MSSQGPFALEGRRASWHPDLTLPDSELQERTKKQELYWNNLLLPPPLDYTLLPGGNYIPFAAASFSPSTQRLHLEVSPIQFTKPPPILLPFLISLSELMASHSKGSQHRDKVVILMLSFPSNVHPISQHQWKSPLILLSKCPSDLLSFPSSLLCHSFGFSSFLTWRILTAS